LTAEDFAAFFKKAKPRNCRTATINPASFDPD
jgi:hypothetical protein